MQIHQLTSFTEQDFRDLAALMKELSDRLELTEEHLRDVVAAHGSRLFVAREGGRIIGCATLCIYEAPSSRKGVIEDVVVAAEFRGRHIGRTLLQQIFGTARTMAPIELQLTSKPARTAANALYSTLGFTRMDTNCYRIKL